jgi:hypothetical protein
MRVLALIGDVVSKSGGVQSVWYAVLPILLHANRSPGTPHVYISLSSNYHLSMVKRGSYMLCASLSNWLLIYGASIPSDVLERMMIPASPPEPAARTIGSAFHFQLLTPQELCHPVCGVENTPHLHKSVSSPFISSHFILYTFGSTIAHIFGINLSLPVILHSPGSLPDVPTPRRGMCSWWWLSREYLSKVRETNSSAPTSATSTGTDTNTENHYQHKTLTMVVSYRFVCV